MDTKKGGVFSPCASLDSASMIKCLQALFCEYPSIKFSSVTADKKYGGYRVFFWQPEDSIVLEKNQVSSDGHYVYIYPLTAYLIALNLDHKKVTPLFERELRAVVSKKFGRVISIDKTTNNDQSKNWCIEIDIPEFIDLEDSQRRIYSDMILQIPGRNEELNLKLWCRQCKMPGHFQHECLCRLEEETDEEQPNMKKEENVKSNGQNGEDFNEPVSSSPDRNSEKIPKKTFSNFSLVATESYAEKIGREEVMSFSKEKHKRIQNNTSVDTSGNRSNSLLGENEIKKETTQDFDKEQDKSLEIKKNEIAENKNRIRRTENENVSNKFENSFLNEDDDIEFIGDSFVGNNTSPSHASNSSARGEGRNLDEQSRSSPESKNVSFTSSFSALAGPSYESPSAAAKAPRGAEVTTALSERLQECINQVCADTRVLDRKQLDAFLIHVKKKSNPIRVALNYTANTRGLKEQLQAILHMYYNTPQTGTKEDIQFIKWLNGLVDRYDGSIPKKRKRSNKTDDDYPAKR